MNDAITEDMLKEYKYFAFTYTCDDCDEDSEIALMCKFVHDDGTKSEVLCENWFGWGPEGMTYHASSFAPMNFKIREGFPCHVMNVEYSCEDKSKRPYTIVRDDGSMLKIFQVLQDKLHDGSMGKYPDDETRERDIGLAVMLLESKIELQKMSSPKHESEAERYVDSALRYIQENYTDEIAVQDIASHIGIAPAYLQRLFRAQTGSTITEYITRLRLNCSKYLLTHSELSIVDVAINAGFGSRQRLSQVFAAEEHTSPKQYRMNNKK